MPRIAIGVRRENAAILGWILVIRRPLRGVHGLSSLRRIGWRLVR